LSQTGKKLSQTGKKLSQTGKKLSQTGKKLSQTGKKSLVGSGGWHWPGREWELALVWCGEIGPGWHWHGRDCWYLPGRERG
jgi:hypothetical protein